MEKYFKYLPVIILISSLIGTFTISQYKSSVQTEQIKDIQKTLSDMIVQTAVMSERLKNVKEAMNGEAHGN